MIHRQRENTNPAKTWRRFHVTRSATYLWMTLIVVILQSSWHGINASAISSSNGIFKDPESIIGWIGDAFHLANDEPDESKEHIISLCRKGQTCITTSARNESYKFGRVIGDDDLGWYSTIRNGWEAVVLLFKSEIAPFYWDLLERAPTITKSITACLIGGLGDAAAQLFERSAFGRRLDMRRALSVAAEGLLISGPLMHYAYDWMESVLPLEGVDGFFTWIYAMIHVLIDSVLLDCVFVATMMMFTGILEGKMHQIPKELQRDLFPAIKASWVANLVFSPLQFLVFKFVPIKLRVLAINVQDILWNAVVSFMAHRSREEHD